MMKEIFKTTLKSLGFSVATIFIMNLLIFISNINESNVTQDWFFKLEKGVFYINNIAVGFEFGKLETNGLLLMLFFIGIFMNYKKENIIIQPVCLKTKDPIQ